MYQVYLLDLKNMENTASNNNQNPLSKYFRQPAIYMELPSKGQFWADNSVELPVTGEIPVYPMTARDEVTLRTPDALMNGSGVVEVIHSCCPSIKDAWKMPSVDVDAVLIGIRIASYGHGMDLDTKCPHCSEENRHSVDLRTILSSITCPDYNKKIDINELKIKIRPQPFFGVNKQNTISFEEQRILEALEKSDLSQEERTAQINASMSKLVQIGIDTVASGTEFIELNDGVVVDNPAHISEFYNNADGAVIRSIQKRISEINAEAQIKSQKVACLACTKEYQIPLEFDYANFFANGS